MDLVIIVFIGLFICLITFTYEMRIKKLRKNAEELSDWNLRMSEASTNLLADYKTILTILEESFGEELANEMFIEYKERDSQREFKEEDFPL